MRMRILVMRGTVMTGKMPTDVGGTLAGQILRVLVH